MKLKAHLLSRYSKYHPKSQKFCRQLQLLAYLKPKLMIELSLFVMLRIAVTPQLVQKHILNCLEFRLGGRFFCRNPLSIPEFDMRIHSIKSVR